MNTIKFNTTEFAVESYNKNTYFNGETITSNANCAITVNDINVVNALANDTITTLQILHDGEIIYNLTNISARIESISEYLNGDRVNVSVNLIFDMN